jgi:small subunit ribosomal protein S10
MKIRVFLRSFDKNLITESLKILKNKLENKNIKISHIISLPNKKKRFCVLRSPHGDKDSREHFDLTLRKIFFDFETDDSNLLENSLNMEIPAGVIFSIKIFS